jgi:hypothetical protein
MRVLRIFDDARRRNQAGTLRFDARKIRVRPPRLLLVDAEGRDQHIGNWIVVLACRPISTLISQAIRTRQATMSGDNPQTDELDQIIGAL